MADDLEDTIESEATTPASIDRDGFRFSRRKLTELIAADKHLAGKTAASAGVMGFRVGKIIAPGATE